MDPIDLRDLFRRAQAGDRDALGDFCGHYLERLFRYIRRRVYENDAVAQDLTEATFLDMIRWIDRFQYRSEGEFFGLLVRIAIGHIWHHFQPHPGQYQSDEAPPDPEDVPARDPPIPHGVAFRELLALVYRALSKMPADDRELIVAVSEGKRVKDIAAERGETEGTMRWKLSECRDALVAQIRTLSDEAADWFQTTFRERGGRECGGEDTPRPAPEHKRPRPKRRPKTGGWAAAPPDPRPTAGLDGGATP